MQNSIKSFYRSSDLITWCTSTGTYAEDFCDIGVNPTPTGFILTSCNFTTISDFNENGNLFIGCGRLRPLIPNTSWEIYGYLKTNICTNISFKLNAGSGVSYFWSGDKAVNGFNLSNADLSGSGSKETNFLNFQKDKFIPVRIQWGIDSRCYNIFEGLENKLSYRTSGTNQSVSCWLTDFNCNSILAAYNAGEDNFNCFGDDFGCSFYGNDELLCSSFKNCISVTSGGSYYYIAKAFDNQTGVCSNLYNISVYKKPEITLHPYTNQSNININCDFVKLCACAIGGSNFVWRKNYTPISNGNNYNGVFSDTLTIYNICQDLAGNYDLLVSNDFDSTSSQVYNLNIYGKPIFLNQQNCCIINKEIACDLFFQDFLKYPTPKSDLYDADIYCWIKEDNGVCQLLKTGYENFYCRDVFAFSHTGNYILKVSNFWGSTCKCYILNIISKPFQTFSSTNCIARSYEDVALCADFYGTPPISYKWFFSKDEENYSELSSTYNSIFLEKVDEKNIGFYCVKATNEYGFAESSVIKLNVEGFTEIESFPYVSPSNPVSDGTTPSTNTQNAISDINFCFAQKNNALNKLCSTNFTYSYNYSNPQIFIYKGSKLVYCCCPNQSELNLLNENFDSLQTKLAKNASIVFYPRNFDLCLCCVCMPSSGIWSVCICSEKSNNFSNFNLDVYETIPQINGLFGCIDNAPIAEIKSSNDFNYVGASILAIDQQKAYFEIRTKCAQDKFCWIKNNLLLSTGCSLLINQISGMVHSGEYCAQAINSNTLEVSECRFLIVAGMAPLIISQPATCCEIDTSNSPLNACFQARAVGSVPITYQWQFAENWIPAKMTSFTEAQKTEFKNLSNDSIYNGVNTETLCLITSPSFVDKAHKYCYRLSVSNTIQNNVLSNCTILGCSAEKPAVVNFYSSESQSIMLGAHLNLSGYFCGATPICYRLYTGLKDGTTSNYKLAYFTGFNAGNNFCYSLPLGATGWCGVFVGARACNKYGAIFSNDTLQTHGFATIAPTRNTCFIYGSCITINNDLMVYCRGLGSLQCCHFVPTVGYVRSNVQGPYRAGQRKTGAVFTFDKYTVLNGVKTNNVGTTVNCYTVIYDVPETCICKFINLGPYIKSCAESNLQINDNSNNPVIYNLISGETCDFIVLTSGFFCRACFEWFDPIKSKWEHIRSPWEDCFWCIGYSSNAWAVQHFIAITGGWFGYSPSLDVSKESTTNTPDVTWYCCHRFKSWPPMSNSLPPMQYPNIVNGGFQVGISMLGESKYSNACDLYPNDLQWNRVPNYDLAPPRFCDQVRNAYGSGISLTLANIKHAWLEDFSLFKGLYSANGYTYSNSAGTAIPDADGRIKFAGDCVFPAHNYCYRYTIANSQCSIVGYFRVKTCALFKVAAASSLYYGSPCFQYNSREEIIDFLDDREIICICSPTYVHHPTLFNVDPNNYRNQSSVRAPEDASAYTNQWQINKTPWPYNYNWVPTVPIWDIDPLCWENIPNATGESYAFPKCSGASFTGFYRKISTSLIKEGYSATGSPVYIHFAQEYKQKLSFYSNTNDFFETGKIYFTGENYCYPVIHCWSYLIGETQKVCNFLTGCSIQCGDSFITTGELNLSTVNWGNNQKTISLILQSSGGSCAPFATWGLSSWFPSETTITDPIKINTIKEVKEINYLSCPYDSNDERFLQINCCLLYLSNLLKDNPSKPPENLNQFLLNNRQSIYAPVPQRVLIKDSGSLDNAIVFLNHKLVINYSLCDYDGVQANSLGWVKEIPNSTQKQYYCSPILNIKISDPELILYPCWKQAGRTFTGNHVYICPSNSNFIYNYLSIEDGGNKFSSENKFISERSDLYGIFFVAGPVSDECLFRIHFSKVPNALPSSVREKLKQQSLITFECKIENPQYNAGWSDLGIQQSTYQNTINNGFQTAYYAKPAYTPFLFCFTNVDFNYDGVYEIKVDEYQSTYDAKNENIKNITPLPVASKSCIYTKEFEVVPNLAFQRVSNDPRALLTEFAYYREIPTIPTEAAISELNEFLQEVQELVLQEAEQVQPNPLPNIYDDLPQAPDDRNIAFYPIGSDKCITINSFSDICLIFKAVGVRSSTNPIVPFVYVCSAGQTACALSNDYFVDNKIETILPNEDSERNSITFIAKIKQSCMTDAFTNKCVFPVLFSTASNFSVSGSSFLCFRCVSQAFRDPQISIFYSNDGIVPWPSVVPNHSPEAIRLASIAEYSKKKWIHLCTSTGWICFRPSFEDALDFRISGTFDYNSSTDFPAASPQLNPLRYLHLRWDNPGVIGFDGFFQDWRCRPAAVMCQASFVNCNGIPHTQFGYSAGSWAAKTTLPVEDVGGYFVQFPASQTYNGKYNYNCNVPWMDFREYAACRQFIGETGTSCLGLNSWVQRFNDGTYYLVAYHTGCVEPLMRMIYPDKNYYYNSFQQPGHCPPIGCSKFAIFPPVTFDGYSCLRFDIFKNCSAGNCTFYTDEVNLKEGSSALCLFLQFYYNTPPLAGQPKGVPYICPCRFKNTYIPNDQGTSIIICCRYANTTKYLGYCVYAGQVLINCSNSPSALKPIPFTKTITRDMNNMVFDAYVESYYNPRGFGIKKTLTKLKVFGSPDLCPHYTMSGVTGRDGVTFICDYTNNNRNYEIGFINNTNYELYLNHPSGNLCITWTGYAEGESQNLCFRFFCLSSIQTAPSPVSKNTGEEIFYTEKIINSNIKIGTLCFNNIKAYDPVTFNRCSNLIGCYYPVLYNELFKSETNSKNGACICVRNGVKPTFKPKDCNINIYDNIYLKCLTPLELSPCINILNNDVNCKTFYNKLPTGITIYDCQCAHLAVDIVNACPTVTGYWFCGNNEIVANRFIGVSSSTSVISEPGCYSVRLKNCFTLANEFICSQIVHVQKCCAKMKLNPTGYFSINGGSLEQKTLPATYYLNTGDRILFSGEFTGGAEPFEYWMFDSTNTSSPPIRPGSASFENFGVGNCNAVVCEINTSTVKSNDTFSTRSQTTSIFYCLTGYNANYLVNHCRLSEVNTFSTNIAKVILKEAPYFYETYRSINYAKFGIKLILSASTTASPTHAGYCMVYINNVNNPLEKNPCHYFAWFTGSGACSLPISQSFCTGKIGSWGVEVNNDATTFREGHLIPPSTTLRDERYSIKYEFPQFDAADLPVDFYISLRLYAVWPDNECTCGVKLFDLTPLEYAKGKCCNDRPSWVIDENGNQGLSNSKIWVLTRQDYVPKFATSELGPFVEYPKCATPPYQICYNDCIFDPYFAQGFPDNYANGKLSWPLTKFNIGDNKVFGPYGEFVCDGNCLRRIETQIAAYTDAANFENNYDYCRYSLINKDDSIYYIDPNTQNSFWGNEAAENCLFLSPGCYVYNLWGAGGGGARPVFYDKNLPPLYSAGSAGGFITGVIVVPSNDCYRIIALLGKGGETPDQRIFFNFIKCRSLLCNDGFTYCDSMPSIFWVADSRRSRILPPIDSFKCVVTGVSRQFTTVCCGRRGIAGPTMLFAQESPRSGFINTVEKVPTLDFKNGVWTGHYYHRHDKFTYCNVSKMYDDIESIVKQCKPEMLARNYFFDEATAAKAFQVGVRCCAINGVNVTFNCHSDFNYSGYSYDSQKNFIQKTGFVKFCSITDIGYGLNLLDSENYLKQAGAFYLKQNFNDGKTSCQYLNYLKCKEYDSFEPSFAGGNGGGASALIVINKLNMIVGVAVAGGGGGAGAATFKDKLNPAKAFDRSNFYYCSGYGGGRDFTQIDISNHLMALMPRELVDFCLPPNGVDSYKYGLGRNFFHCMAKGGLGNGGDADNIFNGGGGSTCPIKFRTYENSLNIPFSEYPTTYGGWAGGNCTGINNFVGFASNVPKGALTAYEILSPVAASAKNGTIPSTVQAQASFFTEEQKRPTGLFGYIGYAHCVNTWSGVLYNFAAHASSYAINEGGIGSYCGMNNAFLNGIKTNGGIDEKKNFCRENNLCNFGYGGAGALVIVCIGAAPF